MVSHADLLIPRHPNRFDHTCQYDQNGYVSLLESKDFEVESHNYHDSYMW